MSAISSTSRQKAAALFASSQFIAGRIMLSAMISIAALVSGSHDWPLIWLGLMLASLLGQSSAAPVARAPTFGGAASRLPIAFSFFDTAMYSLASAAISQNGGSACAPFGVTVIMLTMLYVLMHFYMQPRLVLVLNAPCFLGLVYCLSDGFASTSILHHLRNSVLPVTGALFTFYFFFRARSQLERARRALMDSRSEALARAADAQAANRVKSDFLATIGHEIRTPLNGVLGIAHVMSVDELSDRQRERVTIIQSSGESLLAILNDLLDISKIEAGKLELEAVDFVLDDIARGAHATFSAAASAKDLTFQLSVHDSAHGSYRGDPGRLRQVFYNLISNAVKFTEAGEICVAAAYADGHLNIEVRDTGVGIPLDRQAALFEKFVQADASTSRKYGGTGLGLAISNQLITAMGGVLAVQSIEGIGSTFTASIPMIKLGDEVRKNARIEIEVPADMDEVLRVLVAEDNTTNQVVIKLMLNQIGVQPVIVGDGRMAVEASALQEWDVILMDIQMPGVDGLVATREIRQRELATGCRRTPILALTANAMTHQLAEYRAVGMDGLIAKPIAAGELFSALEAVSAGGFDQVDQTGPISRAQSA